MWVWWIVSLLVLIACTIFAFRMIVSSYEFMPADKRFFFRFDKNSNSQLASPVQRDALKILKNKVQHVEDNTTFYQIQFSKFQDRLKSMEEKFETNPKKNETVVMDNIETNKKEEEDWKEMFYEENVLKEKLENDLDFTRQALEEVENKLSLAERKTSGGQELQSDYDSRLHELQSLENKINNLQRELEASIGREKELEQLLLTEITMREKYSLLQQKYTQLLSEADELIMRSTEMNKKDIDHQAALRHKWQLESKLAICKDENLKLKTELDKVSNQNQQRYFHS